MKISIRQVLIGLGISSFPLLALSEVPVVEGSGFQSSSYSQKPMIQDEPSSAMQASQADLFSQVGKLQQEMQALRGQIEIQNHELDLLKKNQASLSQSETAQKDTPKPNAEDLGQSGEPDQKSQETLSQEQATYAKALNQLKDKDYRNAISSLQAYLQKFPAGSFAGHSHYWLGEIYQLQEESDKAKKEFEIVVNTYPYNPKATNAMYKLALIFYLRGDYDEAEGLLTKIVKTSPDAKLTQLASQKLKQVAIKKQKKSK